MINKKVNFKNIKDILNRDEMKKISAGSSDWVCLKNNSYCSGGFCVSTGNGCACSNYIAVRC